MDIISFLRKGKYKIIQGNLRDPNWYNEPTEDKINTSDSSLMTRVIENLVRATDSIFGHVSNDLVRLFLSNQFLFKWYAKREGYQTLLFNIEKDPQETTNIASQHPDIVKDLLLDLDHYEKDIPVSAPYWMITKNWVNTFINGNIDLLFLHSALK